MVQRQLGRRGITDEKVMAVMGQLPRQHFIPREHHSQAYADGPLPIGHGQTISQPYIVALMTESLQVTAGQRVLEIGTGCGYQTAILARLGAEVYTIERLGQLGRSAREKLAALGIGEVNYAIGDGTRGWLGPGQFERIIIAAAAESLPPALWAQLAEGGRLVAPLGAQGDQRLMLLEKIEDRPRQPLLCYCRFVELLADED